MMLTTATGLDMEEERQTYDPKRFDRGRSEGRLASVDRANRAEGRAYRCYQRCRFFADMRFARIGFEKYALRLRRPPHQGHLQQHADDHAAAIET
jgi:hypothetical protein